MIRLRTDDPVLARFVHDLGSQSPRPLGNLRPDLTGASSEDIAVAHLAWGNRVVDEYRSVVVFSELLRTMAEAEAPFATLCAVQRMIGDELRHTELCASVADALGGLDALEIDLAGLGLPPSSDPPAVRSLEIVLRELVVAETESVPALRAYLRAAEDAAVRAVLEILLMDEVRHAAVGRALHTALQASYPRDTIQGLLDRLPRIVARETAYLRAQYRSSAVGGPGKRYGASILPEDLEAAVK
jgi:hypothetical protein